jgi:hypothetical protein
LRELREKLQRDIESKCFICGLTREEVDLRFSEGLSQAQPSHSVGFLVHVSRGHNIWDYLHFIVHLQCKKKEDLSGLESHVFKQVLFPFTIYFADSSKSN